MLFLLSIFPMLAEGHGAADLPAMVAGTPWWVTPLIAVGGPVLTLVVTESLRRRTGRERRQEEGDAGVRIEQLKGMAQIRAEEAQARHDLRKEFNGIVLRLQNQVEVLKLSLDRIKDSFSELYYVRQREWDRWEAWFDGLRRDNPSLVMREESIPKRQDISHLAPIRVFAPVAAQLTAEPTDPTLDSQ